MKKARKQTVQKVMTPIELVNLLRQHGWYVDEITGSHYVMKKQGERNVVSVPRHGKDLHKGLLHKLLQLAHLA